jgi:hypothetical protein
LPIFLVAFLSDVVEETIWLVFFRVNGLAGSMLHEHRKLRMLKYLCPSRTSGLPSTKVHLMFTYDAKVFQHLQLLGWLENLGAVEAT